jgi:orotidine-5'-phosphate decarboxylase
MSAPRRRRPPDRGLDVPDALAGLQLAGRIGGAVSFYKIGLGMLTGGGLALANELKQDHGKRIFLDMKLFDIPATIENAVGAWRNTGSIS